MRCRDDELSQLTHIFKSIELINTELQEQGVTRLSFFK
jgi:hypothetical protein